MSLNYVVNKTTNEIIRDIFLNNWCKLSKISFFFIIRQSFLQKFHRKWIKITLDIQNDIHNTWTINIIYQEKMKWNIRSQTKNVLELRSYWKKFNKHLWVHHLFPLFSGLSKCWDASQWSFGRSLVLEDRKSDIPSKSQGLKQIVWKNVYIFN